MTNNFDISSTGINIEFNGFYDTAESQMLFDENFEFLQFEGYRMPTVLYYSDYGNVAGSANVTFRVDGEKSKKIEYLAENTNFKKEALATWDIEELDGEIVAILEANLVNYACDIITPPKGLKIVPSKNIVVLGSHGYSQGDYARVIYCPDDLEQAWGRVPKEGEIQKMVDHMLWDTPVYARFIINKKEYEYYDTPEAESYEFEREKFLGWVSKESGIPVNTLSSLVPKNLDYL